MSFLQDVAAYLTREYGYSLENLCLVFPNKRAGLFLAEHLAQNLRKPMWSPAFLSIRELMQKQSSWQIADNLRLLFILYEVYLQKTGEKISFEEFYSWGEVILSDFDELDKYLIRAEDLYENLSDLRKLDTEFEYLSPEQKAAVLQFWSHFHEQSQWEIKEKFKSLWPKLSLIYQEFTSLLAEKNSVYEGMMYRRCVEDLEKNGFGEYGVEKYVFVGFNALNPCEEMLFKFLKNEEKALFLWDYDEYYLNHTWHEAGLFLRENIIKFPNPKGFSPDRQWLSRPKNIRIHAVPSETAQTRILTEVLSHLSGERPELTRTAVVLSDEQLLPAVLQNLPRSVRDLNITMGYPLMASPAGSLFEKLSLLQKHSPSQTARFGLEALYGVLSHPYISAIHPTECSELILALKKLNRSWITPEEIQALAGSNLRDFSVQISRFCHHAGEFLPWLSGLCALCLEHQMEENLPGSLFHREYLYGLFHAIKHFEETFQQFPHPVDMETVRRILKKHLRTLRVPFQGEPLRGLQILGILETRAIDFDNLIVLSMNEGIFPAPQSVISFIPYSLRKGFGLATHEHQDAIYAYNFYRLLQRSEQAHLVYHSATSENHLAEKSRYLQQLLFEPFFQKVSETRYSFEIQIPERSAPSFHHTEASYESLLSYTRPSKDGGKRLSPSAINIFLQCSLRFWFQYIEKLREPEKANTETDALQFGKLLHQSMEQIYRPLLGTMVTSSLLSSMSTNGENLGGCIQEAFNLVFLQEARDTFPIRGRNLIIREILLNYIQQILQIDKSYSPFLLVGTEQEIKGAVTIRTGGKSLSVSLGGIIDRLDRKDNMLRIIDYKTGKDSLKVESMESLFSDATNPAALQAFLYAHLVNHSMSPGCAIVPGLYSLRTVYENSFEYRFAFCNGPVVENFMTIQDDVEQGLCDLLSRIFDPSVSFDPTEKTEYCKYCPYRSLCHRD